MRVAIDGFTLLCEPNVRCEAFAFRSRGAGEYLNSGLHFLQPCSNWVGAQLQPPVIRHHVIQLYLRAAPKDEETLPSHFHSH